MRISFYLPRQYLPDAERRKAWLAGDSVTLEQSGKIATAQAWIFQTWAALEREGFPARLVHEIPAEGIVIALTGNIPPGYLPPHNLFLAGIVSDGLPHPAAHVHIVQNSAHAKILSDALFMPHWPQPDLVPRHPARGDAFERIAFFGDEPNLAPELRDPAWRNRLEHLTDTRLEIRHAGRWHDYSDIDAVLAVRNFSRARQLHKPATKLYNAWLARVPFIGGTDSAYASDGRVGTDYLAVTSPEETLSTILRLKNSPDLRHTLVLEGDRGATNFSPAAILKRWRTLLEDSLPACAEKFSSLPAWRRRLDNTRRHLACLTDRVFRNY